jgi:glycine cleavage system H protein
MIASMTVELLAWLSPAFLIDKFIFRVATDRLYNVTGVWAKAEDGQVRVGLSDFVQQRSGDIAFAEVVETGTELALGDRLADIETIKVDVTLLCPVSGTVLEVNPALETGAEVINLDPYGAGWLAVIVAADWPADQARLLTPEAYFEQMKTEAEEETK